VRQPDAHDVAVDGVCASQSLRSNTNHPIVSTPSALSLVSSVQMRAVLTSTVLMRLGTVWGSNETPARIRKMWHETDCYTAFLSHTWAAPGRSKYFALSIAFNGWMALLIGVLVGPLVAWMQSVGCLPYPMAPYYYEREIGGITYALPYSCWCKLVGGVVVIALMMTWHRVEEYICGRRRSLFLDKICIDQDNATEKREGIKSLSAFLNSSNSLIILWSSTYFSRLWCVLELTTWLYLQKEDVRFLPLAQADVMCAIFVVSWLFVLIHWLWLVMMPLNIVVLFFSLGPGIVIVVHIFRKQMRDRLDLDRQLQQFDCEQAQCHSASDRETILATIDEWYHGAKECTAREAFNLEVRTSLRYKVHRQMGHAAQIQYSSALLASLPWWWHFCDYFASCVRAHVPVIYCIRVACYVMNIFLFHTPLSIALIMRLAFMLPTKHHNQYVNWLYTLAVFLPVYLFNCSGSLALSSTAASGHVALPFILLALYSIFTVGAFWKRVPRELRKQAAERVSERKQYTHVDD